MSIVAITRDLPDTFADALEDFSTSKQMNYGGSSSSLPPPPPPPSAPVFCLATCRAQHDEYVRVLQQYVDRVVTLPAANAFPDSVFVEDTMMAVGAEVVLTNPGHASRVGEVQLMEEALSQHPDLKDHVTILDDMRRHGNATCDGGDVLRMGDTMLVGMSQRTNVGGYQVLQNAFHRLNVIPIPAIAQGKAALHLKSVVTNLNDRAILVPTGHLGDLVVRALQDALVQCEIELDVYRLDDMLWCNVVALPGTVIAQKRMNDQSRLALERACTEQDLELVLVDTSALAAKDAALTCCSVLLEL
jgi:N-dimethylarginine dimethylaminohydrolase